VEFASIIISIFSAVLALCSFFVAFMTYKRDRAKLKVEPGYSLSLYEPAEIHIKVTNLGHRPTTLTGGGFRVERAMTMNSISKPDTPPAQVEHNINLIKQLTPIGSGEVKEFHLVLNQWPDLLTHAESPLRAFVVGSDGRKVWGQSEPLLKYMLIQGWKPRHTTPGLLDPLEETLKSIPVHARWMIWKPKHLRIAQLPKHDWHQSEPTPEPQK
jgi:hypothetical protein